MEIVQELLSNEKILAMRAAALHVPFAGTFELTPICNMNCKMCYIRIPSRQMEQEGRLLTVEEWIKIASEAKECGLLYLLLTGGEPFLYPGFAQLYSWLGENGIVVMLNTNGTMLTEERADLLLKYPPRKVNISLYGASRETYEKVCEYPEGFEKTLCAVQMLKQRGIPVKFNCSLTPFNCQDLEKMHGIADKLGIPFQATSYMFPPVRKRGINIEYFTRFEPEKAAEMIIKNAKFSLHDESLYRQWIESKLDEYEKYKEDPYMNQADGFTCFASKNNFWINWKGEMLPCGMINTNGEKVLEKGFYECWESVGAAGKCIHNAFKCRTCDMRSLCNVCAAACMAETGLYDQYPVYLCRMTETFIELLRKEQKSLIDCKNKR